MYHQMSANHMRKCTFASVQLDSEMNHVEKVGLSFPCKQLTIEQQPNLISEIFHTLLIGL